MQTHVDYSARCQEARKYVAKALVDIYSRIGIPEEILSDIVAQFT